MNLLALSREVKRLRIRTCVEGLPLRAESKLSGVTFAGFIEIL